MKNLIIAAFVICLAWVGLKALTVNPASAVMGDSANTATTLVYRDTNGDFAAGTITATKIVSSGSIQPNVYTKTQIDTLVPGIQGQIIVCSNCTVPYVLCTSTGILAAQYVAMKTGSGCGTNN